MALDTGYAALMSPNEHERPQEPAQFVVGSLLGLGGVVVAGVLFAVVLSLVASGAPLLRDIDRGAVDVVNAVVGDRPRGWLPLSVSSPISAVPRCRGW